MAIIYVPKGRAREYSPLAANLYDGCTHGCLYCYAPGIRRVSQETYSTVCSPRKDILELLSRDCSVYGGSRDQVLLSFIGDPYCQAEVDQQITRRALMMFLAHRIPTTILTKGGKRALRDLDLFRSFGRSMKVGATLTMNTAEDSSKWEPGAASPDERLGTLQVLHSEGVRTWASFEPVVDPEQSIAMILRSLDMVDEYRIGKLNHYRGIDATIDWTHYLGRVVEILRDYGKAFYVKQDLREACPSIRLYGNEVLMDEGQAKPFERM